MLSNIMNRSYNAVPFNGTTSNISQIENCLHDGYYGKVIISLFIIAVILSTIFNGLLWIAFAKKKKLRTIAITYVISLSVSDFLTTASIGWLEVYYVWHYPFWSFGEVGTNIQNAFWCFSLVTPFVHVMFIAFDRYFAVTSTTLYSEKKSWKKELLKISIMWLYCIGMVVLLAFHFLPAPGYEYQWNISPLWYYPFLAVHIILPIIICSAVYWKMVVHVKRNRRVLSQFEGSSSLREFKFAKTISVIIFLLYILWIPVVAMEGVYAVVPHSCNVSQLGTFSVWLTCLSGVLNPIIYLSKSPKVRHVVMNEILSCRIETIRKLATVSSDGKGRWENYKRKKQSDTETCDQSTSTSDITSRYSCDKSTGVNELPRELNYSRMTVISELGLDISDEKHEETSFSA